MMYAAQNNMNDDEVEIPNNIVYSSTTDQFMGHFPSSSIVPAPLAIPVNDYEYLCALKSEVLNYNYNYSSNSSGCSSYNSPTSLASFEPNNLMMQRSISSHSLLHKNLQAFSPLLSSPSGFLDSDTSPVRKVFSTGDLHCINPKPHNCHRSESSLVNEYTIIESMSKACRYSPEEKKERIERYRNKRNLRNFNKKIKYECRKTLADSRPRIRGRFARNDEIDQKTSQAQWDHHAGIDQEDDEDDDNNWISILDSISANLIP